MHIISQSPPGRPRLCCASAHQKNRKPRAEGSGGVGYSHERLKTNLQIFAAFGHRLSGTRKRGREWKRERGKRLLWWPRRHSVSFCQRRPNSSAKASGAWALPCRGTMLEGQGNRATFHLLLDPARRMHRKSSRLRRSFCNLPSAWCEPQPGSPRDG